MPKSFLKCPTCADARLRKHGQLGCNPIYRCMKTNHYWMLRFAKESPERELVPFNPLSGVEETGAAHTVPGDWAAEPEIFQIDERISEELQSPGSVPLCVDMRPIITHHLDEGNIVLVTDHEGKILGRVYNDSGKFKVIPFGPA